MNDTAGLFLIFIVGLGLGASGLAIALSSRFMRLRIFAAAFVCLFNERHHECPVCRRLPGSWARL